MRILTVVHQLMPDFVGGTELDTWEVATRLRDKGHIVSIFARAPGSAGVETTLADGVQVTRVRAGPMTQASLFGSTFFHASLAMAFRRAVRDAQPDLVHFQHLRGLPATLVAWSKSQGLPVTISLRDFWFVCPNGQLIDYETGELCRTPGQPIHCARCSLVAAGFRPLRAAAPLFSPVMMARNRLLANTMATADALVVFSPFVHEWFARHGAPEARLRLVHRGIPRPDPVPTRQREADDGKVRFAYVGGLAWPKGVHTVVEAFRDLPPNAQLFIAGDETKDPAYVKRLKGLATHPGVQFAGRLDRHEVYQLLADSDGVLVPSLWYETFSMLTHEAFAMGVPVLASDHGVLADAVDHGENGLLVTPGDVDAWGKAMGRIVASGELHARLKAGVRPPLTMDAYIENLEAEYARVLQMQMT